MLPLSFFVCSTNDDATDATDAAAVDTDGNIVAVVVAPIIIGKKKMDRLGILFAIVIDAVVVVFVVGIVADDNSVVFIFILVLVSHAKVKAVQEAKVVGGVVMIV